MAEAILSTVKKSQHIRLDVTRETELLNQFLRVNVDDDLEEGAKPPDHRASDINLADQAKHAVKFAETADVQKKGSSLEKSDRKVAPSVPGAGRRKPSAGKRIEHEAAKKRRTVTQNRRRRRKTPATLKGEELYTDKDRAAAVNMGNKDIKHSLKEKRLADRSSAMRIPAEAEPGTFLALGNYEINRGDVGIARDFIDKALELNPNEKNALVARSRCYVLLGQPENGLKDAEAALEEDKTFFKAIYQKAESLYYLGDFEHSLMFYHRGHKLRPDHIGFKLGIQKSQKAIENAIGAVRRSKSTTSSSNPRDNSGHMTSSTIITKVGETSDITTSATKAVDNNGNSASSNRTTVIGAKDATVTVKTSTPDKNSSNTVKTKSRSLKSGRKSRLLRELGVDKLYLDNLLFNPDLKCKSKEDDVTIINSIKETVDYLNSRQEFWRQQLPPNLK